MGNNCQTINKFVQVSMSKILSIVIPVFNKVNFTKSCLNDLTKLPKDHEIIIVNNNSTDNTMDVLLEFQKNNDNIVVCTNKENLGFAKACNIGYGASTAPNILFLNNDIRVKSNFDTWTQPLIESCSEALVGPTMGQLDSQLSFVKEANSLLPGNSYMSGWCLAASREIWKKLDISSNNEIFSEEFFCYFEDTDLSFRAKELKIPFKVVEVPVVHFGKTSSKQLNVPALYQNSRNKFIQKWSKRIKV